MMIAMMMIIVPSTFNFLSSNNDINVSDSPRYRTAIACKQNIFIFQKNEKKNKKWKN